MGESVMNYTEELRKCHICGSENFKHVRTKTTLMKERVIRDGEKIFNATDVMCMECGLVQKNPSMDFESLKKFYEIEYLKLYSPSLEAGIPKGDIMVRVIDSIYFMEWLKNRDLNISKKSILNIGSGLGVLSYFLESYGASVESIEPIARACTISKKLFGINAINTNFEDFNARKYDFIIMQNVLEHFHSPRMVLDQVRGLLNPWGSVIVEVPDIFKPYPSITVDAWLSSAHLFSFSRDTIWNLMSQCGFEIINCDYAGDKGKLLIRAVPGTMVLENVNKPEEEYEKLFKMFKEMESLDMEGKRYKKELFDGKDVRVIGKEIYDNTFYHTNVYSLLLAEELINRGMIDRAKQLLESCPYKENTPYDFGINRGTFFFIRAIIERAKGDFLSFKKYIKLAMDNYPPLNKYNIIRNMMINAILSDSIFSRYHWGNARKTMENYQ